MTPVQRLKTKLRSGLPTYGFWVSLESPTITEIACRLGVDWVVIDAEHNHLDFGSIMEHLRVANLMEVVCLVHIAELQYGLIGRMLDLGANGLIIPQIRTEEDVARAVQFAHYPPRGSRGMAADRATQWGRDFKGYVRRARTETLIIPMIETVEAVAKLDEILAVPGIDAILFGPADFSASSGHAGAWEGTGVAAEIRRVQRIVRSRGIPTAILARDADDARRRKKERYSMIGLGSDTGTLFKGLGGALANVRASPRTRPHPIR